MREGVDLVRLLAWTYRDQKADVMSGKGLSTPEAGLMADDPEAYHGGWGACGCAAMEHYGMVGVIIPGTAWRQNYALHPDAEAVHDAVVRLSAMDWMGAALLRRYGRRGETPDWMGDITPMFEPFHDEQDRVVEDRFEEASVVKGRVVKHLFCPVRLYPTIEYFELARGEYRTWFRALERLAAELGGVAMIRFQVEGLGAVPEPWRG